MRVLLLLLCLGPSAISGCGSNGSQPPIDRTGFDLLTCPAGSTTTFDGVTPGAPVDYLELREGSSSIAAKGRRCSTSTDAPACEAAVAAATATGWPSGPDGGIPAPREFFVFVRGDVVGAVGASGLTSFMSPVATAFSAAFLAEVATLGSADCSRPSARKVDGGWEVITKTSQRCGGGQSEQRVFVGVDGTTAIRESRSLSRGSAVVCP